jgi:hypothetical protein
MKRLCDNSDEALREVKKSRVEQSLIREAIDRQDAQCHIEKHRAILDWLTPINYAHQQHDFLSRRQPGTGQWLLDSPEFQTWLQADEKMLFCPGIPGAGKTIITAIVIDRLINQYRSNPNIGIAYVYCNFRRKDEQKLNDLLASLLKQLSETKPSLPDAMRDLYNRHRAHRTRPSANELSKALQSVSDSYSKVFVVVDALDECQMSEGCRVRFIQECCALQGQCRAKLFMTSRFLPEITERFNKEDSLEIRATKDDIKRYVEGQTSKLPPFIQQNQHLLEEIKKEVSEVVDGM